MIDPNYYNRKKELVHFFRICKTKHMSYKAILEYYLIIKKKILFKSLLNEEQIYLDHIWKNPYGWYGNLELCSHCGYFVFIRDIEQNLTSKISVLELEELRNYLT